MLCSEPERMMWKVKEQKSHRILLRYGCPRVHISGNHEEQGVLYLEITSLCDMLSVYAGNPKYLKRLHLRAELKANCHKREAIILLSPPL